MAWVGQCRVAFKANADAILWKQKGKKKISSVLRQLSEESGIPYKTLWRWWNEQEKEKNLKNETNIEFKTNSSSCNQNIPVNPRPLCNVCHQNKVERERRNGKWFYRDKCPKCRKIPTPAYQATAEIEILCPLCGERFKLRKEDLKYEQHAN